jgi:hypothetical protein
VKLNSAQKEALALIDSGHYTGEDIYHKMGMERFKLVLLEAMAKEGIIRWQGEYWERNPFYQK